MWPSFAVPDPRRSLREASAVVTDNISPNRVLYSRHEQGIVCVVAPRRARPVPSHNISPHSTSGTPGGMMPTAPGRHSRAPVPCARAASPRESTERRLVSALRPSRRRPRETCCARSVAAGASAWRAARRPMLGSGRRRGRPPGCCFGLRRAGKLGAGQSSGAAGKNAVLCPHKQYSSVRTRLYSGERAGRETAVCKQHGKPRKATALAADY